MCEIEGARGQYLAPRFARERGCLAVCLIIDHFFTNVPPTETTCNRLMAIENFSKKLFRCESIASEELARDLLALARRPAAPIDTVL